MRSCCSRSRYNVNIVEKCEIAANAAQSGSAAGPDRRMHGIEPGHMRGFPGMGVATKKSDCAGGSCVAPVLAGSLGGPTLRV